MNEMTLYLPPPPGHIIRNSSPGGLRPSTLPLGHGGSLNIESLLMSTEETFCFFKLECRDGFVPVITQQKSSPVIWLSFQFNTHMGSVLIIKHHSVFLTNFIAIS